MGDQQLVTGEKQSANLIVNKPAFTYLAIEVM